MKRLVRNLIPAILMASAMFLPSHSAANLSGGEIEYVQLSSDKDSSEQKKEFWDKFRKSVTPDEEDSQKPPPPPRAGARK